jgi:hypothetical protein
MIDTDKYENHDMIRVAKALLIEDAPLLLEEVKRLRYHLDLMIEKFGEAYLIETLIERGEEE